MIRILHLSDIHFSMKRSDIGFDPDLDVRNEVTRDIRRLVSRIGRIDAVIVSGDIAFAGKRPEFEVAAAWLDEVCNACECEVSAVFVTPGNHDVDRDVVLKNSLILDAQDAIRRGADTVARDSLLMRRLGEPGSAKLMFAPLAEFNEFAARYDCAFSPTHDDFAWEFDFELDDGSVLRVRGMNSTLLSGPNDSQHSLMLGRSAYTTLSYPGVEYCVVAHHPPSWLLDQDAVETSINARTRIQLFGHQHDQRILQGRDFVRLYAGSVNPHRSEPQWQPGYNVIEVSILPEEPRRMRVDVHARQWSRNPLEFTCLADKYDAQVHRNEIRLEPWTRPAPAQLPTESSAAVSAETAIEEPGVSLRGLTNRFFRLTASQKNEITGHLNLVHDSDSTLADHERHKRALMRAGEDARLKELTDLIAEMESR